MMNGAATTAGPIGRCMASGSTAFRFVLIYDHPVAEDLDRVRIVSVWELKEGGLS
jgi:hypothetical protein